MLHRDPGHKPLLSLLWQPFPVERELFGYLRVDHGYSHHFLFSPRELR